MSRSQPATTSDSHRARIVWTALIAASTVVVGGLILSERGHDGQPIVVAPAISLATIATSGPIAAANVSGGQSAAGAIAPRGTALALGKWKAIIIHHSGTMGGTAESMARDHVADGRAGLGHHFLIGNGTGLGDGAVHVGYRWNRQLPGAHLGAAAVQSPAAGARPVALTRNELLGGTISICLMGHGDRRAFTPRQLHELQQLVGELQHELNIPCEQVYLASDLPGTSGPGTHFPAAWFESSLRDPASR